MARFRLMYERFREILSCNDATLQLIADLEDRLSGRTLIPLDLVARRTREAAMDVFVMVKNLNQISGNAHTQLYPALLDWRRTRRRVPAAKAYRGRLAGAPARPPPSA